MEDQALQGLSMIPEEIRDPIKDLEDQRSFAGEMSLLEHHDDAAKPIMKKARRSLYRSVMVEVEDDAAKPIVKKARRLLYRNVKVGVEDGRFFLGVFHCLDKQGNIIMYDTVEFRNVPGSDGGEPVEQRGLGMVLIPARCRTSCHIECSLDEQLDLLSIGT